MCDLGDDRYKLPEFKLYKNVPFEIQVRTVLQHAWAEIEHDRNYKLAGVLPSALQRRLYSIAGVLEIADREFNAIATELDSYAHNIAITTKKGDLEVEINSTSLTEYLKTKLPKFMAGFTHSADALKLAIEELRDMGISSLAQLDEIFTERFLELVAKYKPKTDAGILRSAMLINDMEPYFERAWKQHWQSMSRAMSDMLKEHYGETMVKKISANYLPSKPKSETKKTLVKGNPQ